MVPEPNFFSHLLLEAPWPVVAGLVGVWAVLRVLGTRRRKAGLSMAALAALVLAAGLALVAWLVTTDREHIHERTQALVAATDPLNTKQLGAMIRSAAPIAIEQDSKAIELMSFGRAAPALQRVEVASQSAEQISAGVAAPDHAISEANLVTRLSQPMSPPVPTTWRFHWRRDDDGAWRVSRVVLVSVRGRAVSDQIRAQLNGWLNTQAKEP